MVLPIPRFIMHTPPLNKGEHIAKGTDSLRIYLPKDHPLPAFVLRSLSLDCAQLQEQIIRRDMPEIERKEYENWLIEHNSCSVASLEDGHEFDDDKDDDAEKSVHSVE